MFSLPGEVVMEGRCSRGCGLASIVFQLPYGRKNFSVTTGSGRDSVQKDRVTQGMTA